jgi:hypothetical protein
MLEILQYIDAFAVTVFVIFALEGGRRNWYVWRSSYESMEKHLTQRITDTKDESKTNIADLRRDYTERIQSLRAELDERDKEINYWRDYTLRLLNVQERQLDIVEKNRDR